MTAAKKFLGGVASALNPQCRFEDCIFILGHMRCGSTALSNILCSRPEVSGYGESHIAYRNRGALGVLALNQLRRGVWRPRAAHLFDKILHSRYDADADPAFFGAKAIFICRAPRQTILSIRTMFAAIGSGEYASDAAAADYYAERMLAMRELWHRFPASRRIATTHERVTSDPQAELARVSGLLGWASPLANHYTPNKAAQRRGAGDPIASHRFQGIVTSAQASSVERQTRELDVGDARLAQLNELYEEFARLI